MLTIALATDADIGGIQQIYSSLRRPVRTHIVPAEYFVAKQGSTLAGCAAVHLVTVNDAAQGYLYGLAVAKSFQRLGIGRALTEARLQRICQSNGIRGIALAMFWNVRFFRSVGFVNIPRGGLSLEIKNLPDFQDVRYRRSTVMCRELGS